MEMEVEDVVVVGGGIAGLATALALKRVGISRALVLERSDRLRDTGAALTLFPNAWFALQALGISKKLTSLYAPLTKGYITSVDTGAIQEISFPAINGDDIERGPRAVHRKMLLKALAEELPVESIRFSSKITSIETQTHEGSKLAVVHMEDGAIIRAKVLIGCDGVHSVVANWLGLSEAVHSGRSAARGLAVFPQGHGLKQEVQHFVSSGRRAGFAPLNDKEIYWFFTCLSPAKGSDLESDPKAIQREIIENLAKDLPEIYLQIVQHSDLSTLTWAELKFRYPWKVAFGTLNKHNITVAGDAMHPMTPDLGQGGCSSLEDAIVFGRKIGTLFIQNGCVLPREVDRALADYVEERRWRVTFLIMGSYLSAGLGRDFESVVSTISTRMQNEVVTVSDAIALLLGHESWLPSTNPISDSMLPSANMTQHSKNRDRL